MILIGVLWIMVILTTGFLIFMSIRIHNQANYFQKYRIPYFGFQFGKLIKILSGRATLPELEQELYKEIKSQNGKFAGTFTFGPKAGIYLADLDLIKNICVKDFDHFVNRMEINTNHSNLYFRKMLFALEEDHWKGIRTKLTPAFSIGKIRRMFAIFKRSSQNITDFLKREINTGSEAETSPTDIDFNLVFPKFAMDVIASCAFGVNSKCFEVKNPREISHFEEMGKKFQFDFTPINFLKLIVVLIAPKIADIFKLEAMETNSQKYFVSVIKAVIKRRKATGERCEDFLQLMMDAQQGLLQNDDDTNENSFTERNKNAVNFEDDDIIANCLLFMLGGFDTVQSLLLFTVYNLAVMSDIQEKLFKEVEEKIKSNGDLTYEGLLEMSYLDLILRETLRLCPPGTRTERVCTKDYPVPGSQFVIKKGTVVGIPIYSIHRDKEVFKNPEIFIPERFLPENRQFRHSASFLAFGYGPRSCIGMRFALIEVKTVIAQIIYNYKLEPCPKTAIPMKFSNNSNLKPENGMWLKITPRK